MATTRITPIHAGNGRSVAKALKDVADYMANPFKTEDGEYVSSFECSPETLEAEFLLSKSQYLSLTGRRQDSDVIAYTVRQSFSPGEITPAEANRLGCELAKRFTKNRHAFAVYTHTDRRHIHNHVLWNSTTLDCRGKFRNFFRSGRALRRCSDILCMENGYSVIGNPKPGRGKHYGAWLGDAGPASFADRLRAAIDAALEKCPADFDEFLSLLRADRVESGRRGNAMRLWMPGQKKPTRLDTLAGDYTENAIRERIAGIRIVSAPVGKAPKAVASDRPGLLIDIRSRMREGKGPGYERWAKIYNLKAMAKTLIYLQENGLDDYAVLKEKAAAATARFNGLSDRIKELETGLSANAELQKQIVTYSKTRAVYVEYRKAGYSKKFKELHEADILLHQTAKKYFDGLGITKLPTVASLRAEYAPMLDEKKKAYRDYRQAKDEMRELLTAKTNVDRLLNITERRPEYETERRNI